MYFIATRLLRDSGAGPTILVSPLLALMRNQFRMAERAGVVARTINSENREDWEEVTSAIEADEVDLLLVSPERFNDAGFRADVLPQVTARSGLLVIDEAHCLSDRGPRLPARLPATRSGPRDAAPGRPGPVHHRDGERPRDRGHLRAARRRARDAARSARPESLALEMLETSSQPERLAWLAQVVPSLSGSGVIYVLTIADTNRVASFLRTQGIDAHAYGGETEPERRLELEDALIANEVKALVATSALGMRFRRAGPRLRDPRPGARLGDRLSLVLDTVRIS